MDSDITGNLVYLTKHLTDLETVILHFEQERVFSYDEGERILSGKTTLDKNKQFWKVLGKKNWETNKKPYLEILRETNNGGCADKIEGILTDEAHTDRIRLVLKTKWWPNEKYLPKSFHEREEQGLKLVEHLREKILESRSRSTVICQGATVSGLGGVGKTTTATWFANYYQDLYDHIIWIDCGEKSLKISLENLAMELNVNTGFILPLLTQKCFSRLEKLKCLFIFDNAESYQGCQGVREVLPKSDNMHCIITSRTREWGNPSGDGQILEIQLNAFNLESSIQFLKCNLQCDDHQHLETLSKLLGNLPLALQIAVSTISNKSITVQCYIQRLKETSQIINENFDGYERTINETMKISLECIKNHKSDNQGLAYRILLMFGYIVPDHVPSELFQHIGMVSECAIDVALDLLEKYSLVTITKYQWETRSHVSIHRLLQQVIRHNADKQCENAVIRSILTCENFQEYKILPLSFADEEIQNEFPKLRAEFMDQQKLTNLLKQKQFTEAVQLSLLIKNTLGNSGADYNYVYCLERNGQFGRCLKILETMYNSMRGDDKLRYFKYEHKNHSDILSFIPPCSFDEQGFLTTNSEAKIELIAGLLFIVSIKSGNVEEADMTAKEEKFLLFYKDESYLNVILGYLRESKFIQSYKVSIVINFIRVVLNIGTHKHLQLNNCSISEKLPTDLNFLELTNVDILKDNTDVLMVHDISYCISPRIFFFKLDCSSSTTKFIISLSNTFNLGYVWISGKVELKVPAPIWNVYIPVNDSIHLNFSPNPVSMPLFFLNVEDCTISLKALINLNHAASVFIFKNVNILDDVISSLKNRKFRADKVDLINVEIFRDNSVVAKFLVNDVIDLNNVVDLTLCGKNINLDLDEPFSLTRLSLNNVHVLNWKNSKCMVQSLSISDMDISLCNQTLMKVRDLMLKDCVVRKQFLVDISNQTATVSLNKTKIMVSKEAILQTSTIAQFKAAEVKFSSVNFLSEETEEILHIGVDDFLSQDHLRNLTLISGKSKIVLNLEKFSTLDYIALFDVKFSNFNVAACKINTMVLKKMPWMAKSLMKIMSLSFDDSSVDLNCLPQTIQELHLGEDSIISCRTLLILPLLHRLSLFSSSFDIVKHFHACVNLTNIEIEICKSRLCPDVQLDFGIIPPTVCKIKLVGGNTDKLNIFNTVKLDILILENCPFDHLINVLTNLGTKNLAFVENISIDQHQMKKVTELLDDSSNKNSIRQVVWGQYLMIKIEPHDLTNFCISKKISTIDQSELEKMLV